MSSIDYREKYQSLKLKFQSTVDVAFRLGYEQGQQDAQIEQMQQAQLAQQQAEQQQQMQGQEGEEGQEQDPNAEQQAQGSELDQHIGQLEGMLGKSELNMDDLKKVVKDLKFAQEMKKSEKAVKAISKNMNHFSMSSKAAANLTPSAKKAVSMQEKIVSDLLKSWKDEEQKASQEIAKVISKEGLSKKS